MLYIFIIFNLQGPQLDENGKIIDYSILGDINDYYAYKNQKTSDHSNRSTRICFNLIANSSLRVSTSHKDIALAEYRNRVEISVYI